MLFKSTTGDLSNKEDCSLCSLNKNLWQNPKKIVYSSIAQSVERMTVNHDVTGSSPVGGAKIKPSRTYDCFCRRFAWDYNKQVIIDLFIFL